MNQKPVPTPLHALYAKEHKDDVNLSILLTASHNPWAYGGVNLVTKDGAIAGSEVTQDVANEIIDISEKGGYFINTKNKGKKTTIDEDAFWNSENVTIYTPAGSYAESFAIENNIPYVNQ